MLSWVLSCFFFGDTVKLASPAGGVSVCVYASYFSLWHDHSFVCWGTHDCARGDTLGISRFAAPWNSCCCSIAFRGGLRFRNAQVVAVLRGQAGRRASENFNETFGNSLMSASRRATAAGCWCAWFPCVRWRMTGNRAGLTALSRWGFSCFFQTCWHWVDDGWIHFTILSYA